MSEPATLDRCADAARTAAFGGSLVPHIHKAWVELEDHHRDYWRKVAQAVLDAEAEHVAPTATDFHGITGTRPTNGLNDT